MSFCDTNSYFIIDVQNKFLKQYLYILQFILLLAHV